MPGGKGQIRPEDGKQFSSTYQPAEKWTEKKALKLGYDLIDWMKATDENGLDKGNIFWDEFIVIIRDHHPNLIRYLSKKFSSFCELIDQAKKMQEIKLKKYGVGDRLNASMTKFTLINNHGWKDKTETNMNINTLPKLEVEVVKNESK